MKQQNIIFLENDYMEFIEATYAMPENYNEIYSSLHEHVRGYYDMLIEEPYLAEYRIGWDVVKNSPEMFAEHVLNLQNTLLNVKHDKTLFPVAYNYYESIFSELVKGSESTSIFDGNGVVRPVYQQIWKSFSRGVGSTPTVLLMVPIVDEMEASGWRSSNSWEHFDEANIEVALEFARKGELGGQMLGGHDLEDLTMELPNEQFNAEVKALYGEYSQSHDINVLKDASAFHVLGIYDYANEMEDPETMWSLLDKSFGYPRDEFIANWKKGISFFDGAFLMEFSRQNMIRVGSDYWGIIYISSSSRQGHEIKMTLPKDGIWRMQENLMSPAPEVIPNDIAFQKRIQNLYEKYITTGDEVLKGADAIEIAGLYYYTEELQDYETQHALFIGPEYEYYVEQEVYISNAKSDSIPNFKFQDFVKELTYMDEVGKDEDGNRFGSVFISVNEVTYPWVDPYQAFWMKEIDFRWHIVLTPNF